jgi:hypothetical protein
MPEVLMSDKKSDKCRNYMQIDYFFEGGSVAKISVVNP